MPHRMATPWGSITSASPPLFGGLPGTGPDDYHLRRPCAGKARLPPAGAVRAWRHRRYRQPRGGVAFQDPGRFHPGHEPGYPGGPGDGAAAGRAADPRCAARARSARPAPGIFWSLIASFWIGNVLLILLNVPLIGL